MRFTTYVWKNGNIRNISRSQDVIDIFQQTHQNSVHFLGEEKILKVTEICSYSHMKKIKASLCDAFIQSFQIVKIS